MLFSLIIPHYNKALYVEKSLNSVVSQSFQDWEQIVINDGSTDASMSMAQAFVQAQPADIQSKIQIISQKDAGVSTARNKGVALAKAEYICFLDAGVFCSYQINTYAIICG